MSYTKLKLLNGYPPYPRLARSRLSSKQSRADGEREDAEREDAREEVASRGATEAVVRGDLR